MRKSKKTSCTSVDGISGEILAQLMQEKFPHKDNLLQRE
jgi:hypothetical protein